MGDEKTALRASRYRLRAVIAEPIQHLMEQNMKRSVLFAAFVAVVTLCASIASAQDQAQPVVSSAAPAAPAAEALTRTDTPEYQAFAAQMKVYKEGLKALRALKDEYQTATAERKDQIIAEFETLVDKTAEQQKELVPLACAAYTSIDGQNDELRAFLCSMLQWSVVSRENYELGYDVAKILFQYPLPPNADELYAYAAYAAFCTMNLDDADAWTKVAKEKNAIAKADPNEKMQMYGYLTQVLPQYRLNWAKEKEIREKEAQEGTNPRVELVTTKGTMILELFQKEAPNAVNNFLSLVEKGFYTDVPFHRVLPYFMAQGGDPTGTGSGGPGYCIPCECSQENARDHFRGSLSMAHAGRNTGGSQFFITFVPTYFLNGRHTVFGRVVEGMDVLSDITRIDPEKESDEAPAKIVKATIIRGKGGDFKKLPAR